MPEFVCRQIFALRKPRAELFLRPNQSLWFGRKYASPPMRHKGSRHCADERHPRIGKPCSYQAERPEHHSIQFYFCGRQLLPVHNSNDVPTESAESVIATRRKGCASVVHPTLAQMRASMLVGNQVNKNFLSHVVMIVRVMARKCGSIRNTPTKSECH